MIQPGIPCFVIADGGHARFVFPAKDHALHTVAAFDAPHVHDQSSDLGGDRPGRSFESASVTRHAIAPRHDPHDMEKHKFARAIAKKICDPAEVPAFDELILVAPAHILADIRDHLDPPTATKLTGTLAKDLTKVPDDALYSHLKQWVPPTRRAV